MTDACEFSPHPHINKNVRGLSPSPTVAINDRSNQLLREGRKVFKLGLGQSPFPVPDPVVKALQAHAFEKDYLPVMGLDALRDVVAEHHRRTFGIECKPEQVLVGPGSKELMFLLQLVYDGDIVIPMPAWVSYAPQARIIGREIHLVATEAENGWRITPSQLEETCRKAPDRPRIVVLNYPSNPTGGSYTLDELQDLAEVMRKYRAVVLSDEIYGKLHHTGTHASIVPLYPEGTIFSGGLSKWCGAGGWRLGIFVVPECMDWLLKAMAAVASETYTSTCAPIQHAAIRAFLGGPEIEEYLQGCRRVLRALGHHISGLIRGSGARVLSPTGGFYLFPDFSPLKERLRIRGITTDRELCQRLLDEVGVAILPGSDFGCTPQDLAARLSYVDFNGGMALEAARDTPKNQHLGIDFLMDFCGPTLEAVELLVDWLDRER